MGSARPYSKNQQKLRTMQITQNFNTVSPALDKYAQGVLADLWKRPGLTPSDRSIVIIAALIARNQTIEMPRYFNSALDNGVKPRELSEIITHLAFYSGWGNAASAAAVAKDMAEVRQGQLKILNFAPAWLQADFGILRLAHRSLPRYQHGHDSRLTSPLATASAAIRSPSRTHTAAI
jgi:alkylhydroperoxidase/carboxymuconolactone decarboxylase family protein YurZ